MIRRSFVEFVHRRHKLLKQIKCDFNLILDTSIRHSFSTLVTVFTVRVGENNFNYYYYYYYYNARHNIHIATTVFS